jgi:hypothetical protein
MQKGLLGYYLIYHINNYILNDHVVEIYACRGGQVWWGAPLACTRRSLVKHITCVEKMFASTLVMDGKVAVTERQEIGVNSPEVPCLFRDWAAKNLNKTNGLCEADWKDGIEESTRYGYIAEEICRNRTFFITEAGRLGLGSLHVSPGASIYLIHGLKVPFVIHHSLSMQVFRGECYTYGLMDGETQCSDQDSLLCLE